MRRIALGFLALALVMSVSAGCAPAPSSKGTYTPPAASVDNGFPYGARLGEVSEGDLPGTVSAEVFFPMCAALATVHRCSRSCVRSSHWAS